MKKNTFLECLRLWKIEKIERKKNLKDNLHKYSTLKI